MLTSSDVPHYLRFARVLALASSAALLSCSAVAGPGAPVTTSDGVTVGDGAALAACPATLPASGSTCDPGLQCAYPGYTCYSAPFTIHCECAAVDAGAGHWNCGLCEGPLPPPELAHEARAAVA
jgi:hypothetical protein